MNPIMAMFSQMMKGGGNPQAMLQQMMNNSQIMSNPMAKNVVEMMQKGDKQGLQTMAENMCKENGTTIEQMKTNLMGQFGIK